MALTLHHAVTLLLMCWGIPGAVDCAVVYTHWGRQTCTSPGAQLVYTGYVGGSNHADIGSASNHLCMPRSPTFGNKDSTLYDRARIYGAEYEPEGRSDNFPFETEEYLNDRNALCSVCRVGSAETVLMVPAQTECYPGWTTEYTGYLVAERVAEARTEYICLDKSPEPGVSDGGDEFSVRLFSVEGVCGSLPCPPYENGWEIACCVCTM